MRRRTLARAATILTLVALSPMALYLVPQLGGGDLSYAVLSGSMRPTFDPGDFLVEKRFRPGDPLEPGTIATYREGKVFVTHRVIEARGEPGARSYVFQGDANDGPDARPVPESRIVATYLFHVPYYGYLAVLAGQPAGRLLLVVVPAAAMLALEVRRLLRHAAKPARAAAAPGEPSPAAAPPAAPGPKLAPAAVVVRGHPAPGSAPGSAPRPAPGAAPRPAAAFAVVRRPQASGRAARVQAPRPVQVPVRRGAP